MKLKRLFSVLGALLLGALLLSCSGGGVDADYNFQKDENTSGGFSFSSISINTDEVKKTFYIGDEFTSEGLKVNANYRKMVDGVWNSKEAEITNYSVDSSAFDSTAIGSYDIMVAYREGNVLSNVKYNVQVLPSIYDSLPVGGKYIAAIKATYDESYMGGVEGLFIKEQYVNDTFTFSRDKLRYTLVTNTIGEGKTITSEETSINFMEFSDANFSHNIDYTKIGSYPVRITYDGPDLTIDGKTYKNRVTTFVILNVINPVKKIEKVSKDDTTFVASASNPDYSKWQFKLIRHVNVGEEIVTYSKELFKIDGVSLLVTGEQKANVEYLGSYEGNSRPYVDVKVNINKSPDLDITIYNDLSSPYKDGQIVDISKIATLTNVDLSNNTGVIFGDNIVAAAKTRISDNVEFNTRCQIQAKSKNGALRFVVDKPAILVFYVASTNTDERDFALTNAEGEEVLTGRVTKQDVPTRFEVKLEEAGTYTISNLAKALYFYGAIIALEK